jgi:hypothetical protein
MSHDIFVLEPDNDVYEEVVKLLLEKSKYDLELSFSSQPLPDSPFEKRV